VWLRVLQRLLGSLSKNHGYAMAMQWLCNGYAMAMKKPGDKAESALSPGHYHQAKGW
jgi:hypothetical protein